MIWLTIDIEEVEDMNFNIIWTEAPKVDYEQVIDTFIEISEGYRATAFILGSFAKKYPSLVKKLYNSGIEIGCHGFHHELIYNITFETWKSEVYGAKLYLENLLSVKILGYRSVNWSMPFTHDYYEELVKMGFSYSSSYFPMKNYMYGNEMNKKESFWIHTKYGLIEERPLKRDFIPFAGGFYLRILPVWILRYFFKKTKNPILYIHPYELIDDNLLRYFKKYAKVNIDYLLAFYTSSPTVNKIKRILL